MIPRITSHSRNPSRIIQLGRRTDRRGMPPLHSGARYGFSFSSIALFLRGGLAASNNPRADCPRGFPGEEGGQGEGTSYHLR